MTTENQNKEQFLIMAQNAWEFQDAAKALAILEEIPGDFVKRNFPPDWIEGLAVRMQWAAFPALRRQEQLNLIKEHLSIPLRDKYFDLQSTFNVTRFSTPPFVWTKETPQLLDAFLANEESLGSAPINIGSEKNPPQIKNWIRDYIQVFSLDKMNELAVNEYFTKSANTSLLNSEEKEVLRKLLLVFEWLKLPSIEQLEKEAEQPFTDKPDPKIQAFVDSLVIEALEESTLPSETASQPPTPKNQPSISPSPQAPPIQTPNPLAPSTSESPLAHLQDSSANTKSLKQALMENPQVANQIISQNPITLLNRAGEASPTVQNWILDYRSRYGVSENTPDERRQFLLRSPNGQELTEEERTRVHTILESYDTGAPLNIDESTNQIIFK